MTFSKWWGDTLQHETMPGDSVIMNVIRRLSERAWSRGYEEGRNEMREKVAEVFANDEDEQGKVWKACGLKLVGWDYENNCLDEKFEELSAHIQVR